MNNRLNRKLYVSDFKNIKIVHIHQIFSDLFKFKLQHLFLGGGTLYVLRLTNDTINKQFNFSQLYYSLMQMRFLCCCYPHWFQPVLDSLIIFQSSQPPTDVDLLDVVSLWCSQHHNSLPLFFCKSNFADKFSFFFIYAKVKLLKKERPWSTFVKSCLKSSNIKTRL